MGRDKRGVALFFAGGDQGGANGQGLTSANPLRTERFGTLTRGGSLGRPIPSPDL